MDTDLVINKLRNEPIEEVLNWMSANMGNDKMKECVNNIIKKKSGSRDKNKKRSA